MNRRAWLAAAFAFATGVPCVIVACSSKPVGPGNAGPPPAGACELASSGAPCRLGEKYVCTELATPSGSCAYQEIADNGTTTYCCTEHVECVRDQSHEACGGAAGASYACTGIEVPDGEVGNPCEFTGRTADGLEGACCIDECVAVADASPCVPGATSAYDCPGVVRPSTDPSVTCFGINPDTTDFARHCCFPGTCINLGPEEYFRPGCEQAGATVYACKEGASPSEFDPTIWCNPASGGTLMSDVDAGWPEYCCYPSACKIVYANFACDAFQQTVDCQGNATPAGLDPSLTWCTKVQSSDPATTRYCCNGG